MDILKLNNYKKKVLLFILVTVLCLIIFILYNLYQQTKINLDESAQCKKTNLVAEGYFFISFYEYISMKNRDISVNLIRNGKVIKTYFKKNKKDNYISFENYKVMLTDTIEVKLNKDVYYIHHFKNDFFLNPKHHDCILSSYMINNYSIVKTNDKFYLTKKYLK